MAQPDPSLTPEKRLLELIEEPDAHNKNTGDEAKKTGKGALFSADVLKEKVAAFKSGIEKVAAKYKSAFGIKDLNRILKVVVAVMALVFVADFIGGLGGLREDFTKMTESHDAQLLDLAASKTRVESW